MTDGPPRIFDRRAIQRARARAARMKGDAFLLHEALESLAHRLAAVNRRFVNAIAIDTNDAAFSALATFAEHWTRTSPGDNDDLGLAEGRFDLAVSVQSLHCINDLPGVLVQIRRALKPDGLFLATLFGGETLVELRDALVAAEIETKGGASPRIAPFADVRELGGLLQRAGFALPVADMERTVARYRDVASLVRDLRAHGETNPLAARDRASLSRLTRAALEAHYADRHSDPDGKLRATFEIVHLSGWAPHESQPKALRPGSATTRLATALGTEERPAGETAPKARPPRD